jgi:hypothetical protein
VSLRLRLMMRSMLRWVSRSLMVSLPSSSSSLIM